MPTLLVRHLCWDLSWQPRTGAAQRRRGRRLRAAWRHEQQSIAQALATFTHHSSRGQRTARAGEGVRGEVPGQVPGAPPPQAAGTVFLPMDVDDVPAVGGSRPDRLPDVSGPQEQRRTMEQIVDYTPLPILDDPAPQMVGQVVEVPKIPWICTMRRFVDFLRQPQTAEQLVEVPTIISCSRSCAAYGRPPGGSAADRDSHRPAVVIREYGWVRLVAV